MEIELYYADQLVPTDELFRAMQNGTIDAVQSDDATMASPVDINVFGGYFPFSTRYSLDMPVLFKYYGLDEIWAEAYGEVEGVEWLSAGAWDPLPHLHQGSDPQPGRHEGQARLRRADRRPLPVALRPGSRHPAVGRHRGRDPDRRAGRRRLVRLHRGLRGGLGRRLQLRPAEQRDRRLVRLLLRQHQELGEGAAAPAGALPDVDATSRTTTARSGTGAARPSSASRARRWS